jgi:hypothetical protein
MKNPYPGNVEIRCNHAFTDEEGWQKAYKDGVLEAWVEAKDDSLLPCEILRHRRDAESPGMILYTAVLRDFAKEGKAEADKDNNVTMTMNKDGDNNATTSIRPGLKPTELPREAIRFVDRPYTSDIHLPNAFRHPIGIPDELFPDAWKNLLNKEDGK